MDTEKLKPLEQAKICIDNCQSFVLYGGAGSGKTETLKELLKYLSREHPLAKVVCITHTNVAADEIKMRIQNSYPVSTIHSFLYNLIKGYKRNIKSVIHELFLLPLMFREQFVQGTNEVDYKKLEYNKYKELYNKYSDKLYLFNKAISDKIAGKREYDKEPEYYNNELNQKIDILNEKIVNLIQNFDFSKIKYNETKFNSLKDVSYGHDGLLDIAHLLFAKYPILKKIISDRFDYIFIDEYQDTRASIIEDFIEISQDEPKFNICLFGDPMQSIYGSGIGSVNNYIKSKVLYPIPKEDNFRCSYEVVDLINTLRFDSIQQKVELGKDQSESKRHGNVEILYSIYDEKPTSRSSISEKEDYLKAVDLLITKAMKYDNNAKILLLTNKAIAKKEKFQALYKVFDDRYVEVADRMDEYLNRIQITDLCELCRNYTEHNYNPIIESIKKSGYLIQNVSDKIRLKELFDNLLNTNEGFSIDSALNFAFQNNLLEESETYINIKQNNKRYLIELSKDSKYQLFKSCYEDGQNTFSRIKKSIQLDSKEEFDDYKNRYKKENFICKLFSNNISFSEAINYYRYLNENSKNITMHKTKGSSIDSVIVVMEEFFWSNEYDFSLLYSGDIADLKKRENSQKLIYVACSRARKNLICIRLISTEEEKIFCEKFPNAKSV